MEMICHGMMELTLDGFTEEEIQGNLREIVGKVERIRSNYLDSQDGEMKAGSK